MNAEEIMIEWSKLTSEISALPLLEKEKVAAAIRNNLQK